MAKRDQRNRKVSSDEEAGTALEEFVPQSRPHATVSAVSCEQSGIRWAKSIDVGKFVHGVS
jgi:hypothetical protein